jgi:pimeloyl-ACP methyl ester carboxylesterase
LPFCKAILQATELHEHAGRFMMTKFNYGLPDAEERKLVNGTARVAYGLLPALLCLLSINVQALSSLTPAYLDQYDARKTTALLSNGEKLAYIDTGAHDAPALVLIHGYTDSARDWAPIAPLLMPRFRLIIVDLRGHGASGKPDCCYTRFDFAYDIKLLLDALHIPTADIAGHSLGSLVAQTFAEEWPGATRRLVLISSTGTSFGPAESTQSSTAPRSSSPSWLAPLADLADPIDPDSTFMRDWWKVSIAYNAEFARRQRRDTAAIPAQVWRAIADQSLIGVDLRTMLSRIQAPTLLIWGGRDTLVSDAGRQTLRSGIARAEVHIFPALGHDLFWENPSAVANVLIDFLAKQ